MEDNLISFGEAVKTISRDGDLATIGARGVIFGSQDARDLSGDWFTVKTYFGAQRGVGVDMMLNHGIPLSNEAAFKVYADTLLPPVKTTELDDDGLLYQTVFNLKDRYQKKIYRMVEDGLLSSSSGAIAHTVKRRGSVKNGEVERWIIGEMSLTPHPCEFRLGHVSPLKSLMSDDVFEMDSMRAAIKTMGDESFSLNVPLDIQDDEIKFDPNQARNQRGEWSGGAGTYQGHRAIKAAAAKHGLSKEATQALHDAHDKGKVVNRNHLARTIAAAKDASGGKRVEGKHIRAAVKVHGKDGSGVAGRAKTDQRADKRGGDKTSSVDKSKSDGRRDAKKPASKDDVKKATDRSNLKEPDKKNIIKAHADGKIKTRGDLSGAIDAVRDAARQTREAYRTGKDFGSAAAGKSEELDGDYCHYFDDELKSDDDSDDLEILDELAAGLRGDSAFSEYPDKVRGAITGAIKHIEEMTDARCVKSDRRWSESIHQSLTELSGELASAAIEVKAVADAHAPKAAEVNAEVKSDSGVSPQLMQAINAHQVRMAQRHRIES